MSQSHNHRDVLILGAGLSGIGTACRITEAFPDKRLVILERRERIGGTWDLFRYPGIRSDSDMCSYGYGQGLQTWQDPKVLAGGDALRRYIENNARQFGVADRIHFGLKVLGADWSSAQRRWIVRALRVATGAMHTYSCNWLLACTGYFDHETGFRPEFPGEAQFRGQIVHPQFWPENLDYRGKQVVVIGSGATAITLAPSMADTAAHVTLLQRSPTYIHALPAVDTLTQLLSRVMPASWAYRLARARNIWMSRMAFLACQRWPQAARRYLLSHVRRRIGPNVDMRHFTPRYLPWDERLCVVPDGDLFEALRADKVAMETDHIERFTENGILLKSGKELPADLIVTATGLTLRTLGGVQLSVDGVPRPIERRMTYKGVLLQDLPNLGWIFGYTNASWTLKVELAAQYLCRLFRHMDEHQLEVVTPKDHEGSATEEGILDSLKAGYVQRLGHMLPRQGRTYPWRVLMHYGHDRKMLLRDAVDDPLLEFLPVSKIPSHDAPSGALAA